MNSLHIYVIIFIIANNKEKGRFNINVPVRVGSKLPSSVEYLAYIHSCFAINLNNVPREGTARRIRDGENLSFKQNVGLHLVCLRKGLVRLTLEILPSLRWLRRISGE